MTVSVAPLGRGTIKQHYLSRASPARLIQGWSASVPAVEAARRRGSRGDGQCEGPSVLLRVCERALLLVFYRALGFCEAKHRANLVM